MRSIKNNEVQFFTSHNFHQLCNELGQRDADLNSIIEQYSYPSFWSRVPSFETLIHFILEQQVSLASAQAALLRLQQHIGTVAPQRMLALTDEELRSCYFSRQKIVYARELARAVINGAIDFKQLQQQPDDAIRTILKQVKGVGDWTVDVYLMMSLHRRDLFPLGDVALVNSLKSLKQLPPATSKEELFTIAAQWKPYRTIAAYLLWHRYLAIRQLKRVNRKATPFKLID